MLPFQELYLYVLHQVGLYAEELLAMIMKYHIQDLSN
jgi:hypothetical protein